jgi:uncharacterized damage-inducible protein DinB
MARGRPLEVGQELIEAFRRSGMASAYLASVLPEPIWRMAPPGGRGRTIAAIFAHMQGLRRTFARFGGVRPGPPALDRERASPAAAARALHRSTEDLAGVFESALATGRARVKGMPRRVVDMITYLMQHDAHHRGQICLLTRDFGHAFSGDDTMRMWGWKAMPPESARPGTRRRAAKAARRPRAGR